MTMDAIALTGKVTREQVSRLQAELSKLPQYEPKTEHFFHGGMYCRKVICAADVTITGAVHKSEHLFIVAAGTVHVTSDDGLVTLAGGDVLKSGPGTKRAIWCETAAVFMTVHKTEALTVEDAEALLIEPDETSMFSVGNVSKLQEIQ